ncbi:MAG: nitrogen fixation protein NifQ [Methylotetracoccus sp.]
MHAIVRTERERPDRDDAYRWLAGRLREPSPNGEWVCRMLATWSAGIGVLPDGLGLERSQFDALQTHFLGRVWFEPRAVSGLRVDYSRMLEREDLLRFLLAHAAVPESVEAAWIAGIIVAGCLGSDHLWQDLGLWSRSELSGMIAHNFPAVAAMNSKDMKWKKFLYKRLCEQEGIYVCRAPSCEVCADYTHCFGSEE